MFTVKNVWSTKIAKDIDRTAVAGATVNETSDLLDGEVVVTDVSGKVLNTTTVSTVDKVVVVQRSGSNLLKSPIITLDDVNEYSGSLFRPKVEQVTYVGFNGVAGSGGIESLDDNTYTVRIHRRDIQKTFGNKEMLKWGSYHSFTGSSSLEPAVAAGVTENLIKNFKREAEVEIKFERVNGAAATNTELGNAATPTTGNLTLTNKSKTVTMTDTSGLTAGDYIRIDSSATETLGGVVYKVESVDSATKITLDIAFQGDSVVLDDDFAHLIPAATIAAQVGDGVADGFGIKMTGQPREFKVGEFKYSAVTFVATLGGAVTGDSFGVTTVTNAIAADAGLGEGEQVAEMEWFGQGFDGFIERIGTPSPVPTADAIIGNNYSLVTVGFKGQNVSNLGGTPNSPGQLIIAADKGQAFNADDFTVGSAGANQHEGGTTSYVRVLDKALVTDRGIGTLLIGTI